MNNKNKTGFKIITIIFLILFLGSLSYATIKEIRYLKVKDDLPNIVDIKEKECLVYDKLEDTRTDTNGNQHSNYYIYIKCGENEDKINVKYKEFNQYVVGKSYTFYTANEKDYYLSEDKVLSSYNPAVLFVIPFLIFMFYLIVLHAYGKI